MDLTHTPKSAVEKVEDAIVELLKPCLHAKYFISIFPDKPEAFDIAKHKRVALVQYSGSQYKSSEGVNAGLQMRRSEFHIHLYLSALDLPIMGERTIEHIRHGLQGARIEGGNLMFMRDRLVEQDQGLWHYVIDVAIDLPAIATPRTPIAPIINSFEKRDI